MHVKIASPRQPRALAEHDLFGKPVSTFADHALGLSACLSVSGGGSIMGFQRATVRASPRCVEKEMADKVYEVPAEWTKRAFIDSAKYRAMYHPSLSHPHGFCAEQP